MVIFKLIGRSIIELENGIQNVDGQTHRQTDALRSTIFSGNIFILNLGKMAIMGISLTVMKQCRDFLVIPSRPKGIIGKVLKFAVNFHHNKSFPVGIFGLILKNKVTAVAVYLMVMQQFKIF